MIADVGQLSYNHSFMPFLSPQKVCSRAGTWATVRIKRDVALTRRKFYTEDFTCRSLYTEWPLDRAASTQTLLRTDAFADRSFYTEKPFLKEAFTNEALTQSSFTHRCLFTKKLLHTQTLCHTEAFT